MGLIDVYKRYKNSYENYYSVILKRAMKKKVIPVKLRDGTVRNWLSYVVWYYSTLDNPVEEGLLTMLDSYSSSKLSRSPIEFTYNQRMIRLFPDSSGADFGGFLEIFVGNAYKELLPCEGEIVIDVGANIGDSSIYFALNNADKVIALEPFPGTYNAALKNIKENSLGDRITLLNAGYGEDSEVFLDGTELQDTLSLLKSSSKGMKINTYSLETLLSTYNIDNAILKMDCEGCEYQILNESVQTLKRFKKIQIEFHYGYKALEQKLKDAGFLVRVFGIHTPFLRVDPELKKAALKIMTIAKDTYWLSQNTNN